MTVMKPAIECQHPNRPQTGLRESGNLHGASVGRPPLPTWSYVAGDHKMSVSRILRSRRAVGLGTPDDRARPRLLVLAPIFLLGCTISMPGLLQGSVSPQGPGQSDPSELEPVPPSDMELSALSGEWAGLETLTSLGQCKLEGGSESLSYPVSMRWTVDDEGNVGISLPAWPGVYPYTFAGEAQPDLSVSL